MKLLMALTTLFVVACLGGCDKLQKKQDAKATMPPAAPVTPPAQPQPAANPRYGNSESNAAAMAVRRQMDLRVAKNDLDNIGKFYIMYNTMNGKSPASLNEFLDFMSKDAPSIAKALKEKKYTVTWNANLTGGGILAYETETFTDGSRQALKTDGSVHYMTTQDFQAAKGNR